jgi:glycogen(starch) synthase
MTDEVRLAGGDAPDRPIDVVVVASWFPAYDDPAQGRFVADQVEGIAGTGQTRPVVVTFDLARLTGGARSRGRQAEVVLEASSRAIKGAAPLFASPAWALDPSIGVARLVVPDGLTRAAGPAHAAIHREHLLRVVAGEIRRLRSLAGTHGLGIVHAHTVYPDGAAAIALADELGWPLIVTEHSSFVARILSQPERRAAYERVLDRAQRVLPVSRMLADELRTAFPAHGATIQVMPNAVPIDRFRPSPMADRRPDELLFVGYRKATKGIANLLEATAIVWRARPSIRLRLIGDTKDPVEERGWRELATSLGIADVVAFEEGHDRAGVAAAMARASVFVHPSPRETFGVVAVEALASGTPVVATDSGGVTEIMGDRPEELGALVPADDPAALADAIVATLDRRESFDPAAMRGSIEQRFDRAVVAERIIGVYREVLAGPGRATSGNGPGLADDGPTAPDWRGLSPIAHRPAIVVGLDRARLVGRLARMPGTVRRDLVIVTEVEPAQVAVGGIADVVTVRTDVTAPPATAGSSILPGVGRLTRLARDPVGTIRRRLGLDASAEPALRQVTNAVRKLVEATPGREVVAMDGHDALAVAPLVRSGTVQATGSGLRRLADADPELQPGGTGPDPSDDRSERTSER